VTIPIGFVTLGLITTYAIRYKLMVYYWRLTLAVFFILGSYVLELAYLVRLGPSYCYEREGETDVFFQ
jgi:hypothetical protein